MFVYGVRPPRSLLSLVVAHCRRYKLNEDARRLAVEMERAPDYEPPTIVREMERQQHLQQQQEGQQRDQQKQHDQQPSVRHPVQETEAAASRPARSSSGNEPTPARSRRARSTSPDRDSLAAVESREPRTARAASLPRARRAAETAERSQGVSGPNTRSRATKR